MRSDPSGSGLVPAADAVTRRVVLTRAQLLRNAAAAGMSLSLVSVLAACGDDSGGVVGSGTGTGATASGSLAEVSWALGGSVVAIDTVALSDSINKPVLYTVLEGLMRIDADGRLQPGLAERWEQPDELTNVFTLREGVKFSDGTPLTVEDVVYTYQRQMDRKLASANAFTLGTITSVEATGEREITFKLASPSVQAQFASADAGGLVISKAYAEARGRALGTPDGLTLGTGPYAVESFVSGKRIVLRRNEHYWGERPAIERLELSMFDDEQGRQIAMRTGTVVAAQQFPLTEAKQWEAIGDVRTQYAPFHRVAFLSFDLTQAPWNDLAVRRAFAYGVDREGIVASAAGGHGGVPPTVSAPMLWESLVPGKVEEVLADVPRYEHDPERAKAELAKSPRYANGVKARMTVDKAASIAGQAVAESMREIGIELDVRELPTNDFYAAILPHKDIGLALIRFGTGYPDPEAFLSSLMYGPFAVPNNFNTAGFRDAEVDKMFDEQARLFGRVQSDPEGISMERARLLARIATIGMTQLPYLPLVVEDASIATRSSLEPVDFNGWYTNQPSLAAIRSAA